MKGPRFIPDNYLSRLARKLSSSGHQEAFTHLSDDFGDPAFLAGNYIQPHCQIEIPSEEEENVDRRPVFAVINEFLVDAENVPGDDSRDRRRGLFLLGDTGMGKTSLLIMIKLAHMTALWPRHYHCELMKLGSSTLEMIDGIKAPKKTILLLDALNEDPEASGDLFGRLNAILRATRNFHRVIVSCRTAYFQGARRDRFNRAGAIASDALGCTALFLSLFNDTQKDKYLKRRFRRMEEPLRRRAKGLLDEMGALRNRPLLLSHTDEFLHSRCKVWNPFSTYQTMVEAWLEREERRIRSADAKAKFSRDMLLETCIKVARLLQLDALHRCLSRADLAGSHLEAVEIAHLDMLDFKGRSLLRRDSTGAYRFTHASIQEFLIALGIKNGVLPSGKKRIPGTDWIVALLILSDDARTEWRALDLTLASLAGAELHTADFSHALLVSADLVECVFHAGSFDHADLRSGEVHGAKFNSCSFESTMLAHASLHYAAFSGARFLNASLAGSVLTNARFDGCHIDHTGFADANLDGSVFATSTISDCSFKSSRLCGAEFRDGFLANVRFDHCSLSGTKFSNTSLQDVSLLSADLRGADLDASFLDAVRGGAAKNWKSAAWDPPIAATLKLSPGENERNAKAIENDLSR